MQETINAGNKLTISQVKVQCMTTTYEKQVYNQQYTKKNIR